MSANWDRAVELMPGGVNSPVRAFNAVGGEPPFIASASGPHLRTTDGDDLIDFIASWGAIVLEHAEPSVVEAISNAAANGTSYGVPTLGEVEFAEQVTSMVPSIEMMRMVNSGTEATASALRLARGATGRDVVVKFEGCYHGHADAFLVKAGSGAATLGEPDSPGVPQGTASTTRIVRFNDLTSVSGAMAPGDVAAVIVEPVAGNMGVVPPDPGFLEGLRSLTDDHEALLIFDEVMTGFRVGPQGAQGRYGITPDLTTLGKIVAGGTPAAVYGGRRDLMSQMAPSGPIYQAGTLAGNPITVAAGLVTLRRIASDPALYDRLEASGAELETRLDAALSRHGIDGTVQRVGAMLTVFFGPSTVRSWDDAVTLDRDRFARFFNGALSRGVLLPPSPFEAMFLMDAHTDVLETAATALESAIGDAA
ncbi:MAG: glutamate-1-semialdehyde 2,1-aminomutase [Actinomycetia bacterium]|nr:glutamate-1-semialdehyde 2,1-aminomutase [Actinomycetes bacterium]